MTPATKSDPSRRAPAPLPRPHLRATPGDFLPPISFTPCNAPVSLLEAVSEASGTLGFRQFGFASPLGLVLGEVSTTGKTAVKSFNKARNQYVGAGMCGAPIYAVVLKNPAAPNMCVRENYEQFASGFFEGKPRRKTQTTPQKLEALRLIP